MGWCSATEIFDSVCGALLAGKPKEEAIAELIDALEENDWDCQQASKYWENPVVNKIFREKHPDWFDEDEEDDRPDTEPYEPDYFGPVWEGRQ